MLNRSEMLGLARFVTMQNHYNLVYREEEREMIPLCVDQGIGIIPYSPLARGFLTGNRRREDRGDTLRAKTDAFAHKLHYRDSDFALVGRLTEIARERGVENAGIALAWILSRAAVSAPIVGASKIAHLEQAVQALEIRIDESEIKALDELYQPHPTLSFE